MMKNLLATVGFVVVVHYSYQHYLRYQRLKAEKRMSPKTLEGMYG